MKIDLSIFNPAKRPLIGLDISSLSVKMVELVEGEKGGHQGERYGTEPLPREAVVDGKIVNIEVVSDANQYIPFALEEVNLAQEVVRVMPCFFTSTPDTQMNHVVLTGGVR